MIHAEACKVCGSDVDIVIEILPYRDGDDIAVIRCCNCRNIECDVALYGDSYADKAIERWNAQVKK